MEVQEFSELLVKARNKAKISKTGMSRHMSFTYTEIQRIEKALNNYRMDRVFRYLKYINACIFVSNDKKTYILGTEEALNVFFQKELKDSQLSDLAVQAGINRCTIYNIKNGNNILRIDTFLKLLEALGYKIEKIC